MVGVRWCAMLLLVAGLAGCTDDGGAGADPDDTGDGSDGAADGLRSDPLLLAPANVSTTESFTGTFQFQDSQEFDDVAALMGMEQEQFRAHDLTPLLPPAGLFAIEVAATADPGSGDIDVWFQHEGTIRSWWCDCPFGGDNRLTAYGSGDGGEVTLYIQYDEVSTGPDDPDVALQGFDYTLDVQVSAAPATLAPGLPFAVDLDVGESLRFARHGASITVYGPDDAQVAVLGAGDDRFTVGNETRRGEYVFIQRLDGTPFQAHAVHRGEDVRTARLLDVVSDGGVDEVAPGAAGSLTFEAPPSVIEVGGCGIAYEVTVDPAFQMLDPAGEAWVEAGDGGPALGGWGVCYSNWPGDPDQQPGTWTVEFEDTAGNGGEVHWWVSFYRR